MEEQSPIEKIVQAISTSERLYAMSIPLRETLAVADRVLEADHDLKPEIDAIKKRVEETIDHVLAAFEVARAKLGLAADDL